MDLKKLPPSMLVALGLGCVTEACLSPPIEPTESSTSGADSHTNTVGPCLSPPIETSEESEVGPCLGQEETFTGTSTETGTATETGTGSGTDGTGTDSGSGSGSGSDGSATTTGSDSGPGATTVGPCLAPPGVYPDEDLEQGSPGVGALDADTPAHDRQAALDRVLDRDVLPTDVADRLRRTLDD